MFIPLSCDAPIYHWPFATVGMIIANIAASFYAWMLLQDVSVVGEYSYLIPGTLIHGDGLHPTQWVTSMFIHADILHLGFNMLFLWIFGLIVEGKVGWLKFLLIYLGVGVLQSAFEQLLMLSSPETIGSLGASSAIYGLMLISLVWAPKNDVNCFYWFTIWAIGTVDVPVMVLVAIYVCFDVFGMMWQFWATGIFMSTGWLHITGGVLGALLGVAMVRMKMVDCEGWDIFSVIRGADPKADPDYTEVDKKVQTKIKERAEGHLSAAKEQFLNYLSNGNPKAAATLWTKMRNVGEGIELDQQHLVATIRALYASKEWKDSVPFLSQLIERYPAGADGAKLKLAQICVTELQRPARALELLGSIDFSQHKPEQLQLAKKIAKRAKQLQAEGVYEVDTDDY